MTHTVRRNHARVLAVPRTPADAVVVRVLLLSPVNRSKCFGRGQEAAKCWALARALITGQFIQRHLCSDVLKTVVEAYLDKLQPNHVPRSNNFCRSVLNKYCQDTGLSAADICNQFNWDGWALDLQEPLSESEDSLSDSDDEGGAASAAHH
jgi:hypothetical protein